MQEKETAANDLVDIFRDIVRQELSKTDSTILCQVKQKRDDVHYDLAIVPDEQASLKNIPNMTGFSLESGDYVYVFKIRNSTSNCFIVSKVIPTWVNPSTDTSTTQTTVTVDGLKLGDQVTYDYSDGTLTITTVE